MQFILNGKTIDTDDAATWSAVTLVEIADHVAALDTGVRVNIKRNKAEAIDRLIDAYESAMPATISLDELAAPQPIERLNIAAEVTFTATEIAGFAPSNRTYLAKVNTSVKQWFADGCPNKTTTAKRKRSSRSEPQTVRFSIDGKNQTDHQNNLSALAWFSTGRNGGTRVGVAALRCELEADGISDPLHTTWTHTLPNGVQIAAEPIHPKQKVPAAK